MSDTEEQVKERANLVSRLKHDMKNAMVGISTTLEIMEMDDELKDSEYYEDFQSISEASYRLRQLISDLGMVFCDLPDAKLEKGSKPWSELREELQKMLEYHKIPLDCEVAEEPDLVVEKDLFLRALYYLYMYAHENGVAVDTLKLQVAKEEGFHLFELKGDFPAAQITEQMGASPLSLDKGIAFMIAFFNKVAVVHGGESIWDTETASLKLKIAAG